MNEEKQLLQIFIYLQTIYSFSPPLSERIQLETQSKRKLMWGTVDIIEGSLDSLEKIIVKLLEDPTHKNETKIKKIKKNPKRHHTSLYLADAITPKGGLYPIKYVTTRGPIRKVCLCWACTLHTITKFDAFLAASQRVCKLQNYN